MATEPFDPGRHMSRLNGKDYLEVKWRLVWLRDRHPNASIVTKLLSDVDNRATFVCDIAIPEGGNATGHGSETAGDFRDYLEKAETKSIGRALAALGFGTQFCDDHNFGADAGRVVDTPVARNTARKERPPAETTRTTQPIAERATAPESRPQQAPDGATPAQLKNIERLVTKLGKDRQKIKDYYRVAHLADLSKAQASQVIERYMVEAGETQQAMPIEAALAASGEPGNDALTR